MKEYIKFPSGDDLDHVVDEFKTRWEYHNALVLLMDVTSPFVLQVNNTQTITTGKAGIQ